MRARKPIELKSRIGMECAAKGSRTRSLEERSNKKCSFCSDLSGRILGYSDARAVKCQLT